MLKQALSNLSDHLPENRIYQKKSFLSEIENNVLKCFTLSQVLSIFRQHKQVIYSGDLNTDHLNTGNI